MASVLLLGLSYVGIKVYKVVGTKDKIVLTMVVCLNLELASKIVFYVANALEDREVQEH